jgi:hypothetical protein
MNTLSWGTSTRCHEPRRHAVRETIDTLSHEATPLRLSREDRVDAPVAWSSFCCRVDRADTLSL